MPSTLSPNMSLILPTVGQEPGPNWALDLNNSLSTVDQHNHAPGSGVQITPAGMDINVDLPFGGNNATGLRSARFNAQGSAFTSGSDIGCIYVYGADLYYRDTASNNVRLTIGGAVAGTPGSIGGLVAPASVNYVPANQTYVFQSNVNTSGAIDCGPLYLRNIVAASNYIQISPPAVLPASYTVTLPSSLPAAQALMSINNLGNIASVDPDNSTVEINANTLRVKDLGITTAKLADNAVTTIKITDLNVTTTKINDGAVTYIKRSAPNTNSVNLTNVNAVGGNIVLGTVTLTTAAANSSILVTVFPHMSNGYATSNANAYLVFSLTGPGGYSVQYYYGTGINILTSASYIFDCVAAGTYSLEVEYVTVGSVSRTQQNLRVKVIEYR